MAARVGVRRDDVVAQAIEMLDAGARPTEVSLGQVARRLGIRPQSLYAHVDGADGLSRAVAIAGLHALAARVTPAAIGRSGIDGVGAIVRAHLDFASSRTGLYLAAIRPPADDAELSAAISDANRPLEIMLDSLGIDPADQVHWTRLFLASVIGFVTLRRDGRLSLPVDVEETAERLVTMLLDQLCAPKR